MMIKKLNGLTILFIVTVVMVLLMLVTIYRADDDTDDFGLLFPGLIEELNEINTIQFKSTQGEFSLVRDGENWSIPEHFNYPADFNEVKRMIIDLSESKILERKTAELDGQLVLGVEGADEGGESIQVTLLNGEQQVAGLIMGNMRELTSQAGPQQYYVRRQGEQQSWLAEGYFQISPIMLNWIRSEITNIARERIAKVEISQPSGETAVLINLGKKDKFGTPKDGEKTIFKYAQLGYDIAGSLHQLRMEDVQPLTEFSRGDSEVVTAKFTTFDGLIVTTETSFIDGFYYTTLSAGYDAAAVKPAPEDIQEADVLKSAEEVQAEADALNKLLAPWVYRVSGFIGTNLMRAKADIVTERNAVIPMPADMTGFGPR